ncbi:MAG: hypothetical protein Q605_AUC00880G0004, partial [Actinomyces urogenitalis DORA_12]
MQERELVADADDQENDRPLRKSDTSHSGRHRRRGDRSHHGEGWAGYKRRRLRRVGLAQALAHSTEDGAALRDEEDD